MSEQPVEAWKNKINWFLEARYFKDLNRIVGEPMELEWKNFPGFTKLQILDEIQKMMTESTCEPEQFKGRIIFMERTGKHRIFLRILLQLRIMLADSCLDVGHFGDLDQRRNGMVLILINQTEMGTRLLKE